jgi:hypothetical protein
MGNKEEVNKTHTQDANQDKSEKAKVEVELTKKLQNHRHKGKQEVITWPMGHIAIVA